MKPFICACLVFLSLMECMRAGEEQSSTAPGFTQGTHVFEGLVGYFDSIDKVFGGRPRLQTALGMARYGWMLNNQRSGIFFGNDELLLEGFVGPVVEGPGSALGGGMLLLRHNFAWDRRQIVVPYFQIGAGLVASDAYSEHDQFAIGLPIEFNLQGTLGVQWRVSRNWSIQTEWSYRHISNAGLSSRNGGYDLLGGLIGLGRMF